VKVLGQGLVVLPHSTRRTWQVQNYYPTGLTLWGIFAACGRPPAAEFYIVPHFQKFVKQNSPLFQKNIFPFFSKNRLTKSIACSIIKVRKAKESKTNGKSNLF
jgi:hypothetical protein